MGLLAAADSVGLICLCGGLVGCLWGPAWMVPGVFVGAVLAIGSAVIYAVMYKSGTIGIAAAADGLVCKLPCLRRLKLVLILLALFMGLVAFFGGVSLDNPPENVQPPFLSRPEPAYSEANFIIGWACSAGMVGTLQLLMMLYGKPHWLKVGGSA